MPSKKTNQSNRAVSTSTLQPIPNPSSSVPLLTPKTISSSITITPAQPVDHDIITQLAGALFPKAKPTFESTDHYLVARLVTREAFSAPTTLNSDKRLGDQDFSPSPRAPNTIVGERSTLLGWVHLRERPSGVVLQGLAVHPLHQKKGIGRSLLLAGLNWAARVHPGQSVALKVKASNAPALSLYMQEGFMLSKDEGGVFVLQHRPPN